MRLQRLQYRHQKRLCRQCVDICAGTEEVFGFKPFLLFL